MKIKPGFLLREIADTFIVMPIGSNAIHFDKMLRLNTSAAFLWRLLEKGIEKEELLARFSSEYNIDDSIAQADVEELLTIFWNKGILEL